MNECNPFLYDFHLSNAARPSENTEVFTPTILKGIDKDKHKNIYRFECPYAGQFRCSLTSLVFVMKGKGEVSYKTVSWDPRLLDGLGEMSPAGPLYDIDCFDGSISGLHLPHCEIFSEGDMDCLAVAHFTDGNVEKMNPLKVTEAHVMIDIKHLSLFGLIKRMFFPPSPIIAQVLVFQRPLTERQRENVLDVHLLPSNVPLSETKVFEFHFSPNYHPTFEVFVNVRNMEVTLSLMDNNEGREVWPPRRIRLAEAEFVDNNREFHQ
ncbi:NACHT, LRR and PYD domains-containing protein 1-like [Garra rufa]|uniref:NACHT, LRR and PYD domains-containing protein 1-like n=1 Tax=Garra rufa TaxID=137080 RepID=UPI003CCED015